MAQFSDDWVSEEEILVLLQGVKEGTLKQLAIHLGISFYHLNSMREGHYPVSDRVAKHFGFEVVKVFRRKAGNEVKDGKAQ